MEIVHNHEETDLLKQLHVLLPRYTIRGQIYEQLYDLYRREKSGNIGESSLRYYLTLANIKDCLILYGLRLREPNGYFQIDTIVLTKSVCFIIEVKNMIGSISFNNAEQMIRVYQGTTDAFPNPMVQARVQVKHLEFLIKSIQDDAIPIHPIVAFTHPNAILNGEVDEDIVVSQHLPDRINAVYQSYPKRSISLNRLRNLANQLKNKHEPRQVNVMDTYQINPNHIRNGVWCPSCKNKIMDRRHGIWYCSSCELKDKSAHLQALKDYALLFGGEISSKQAKDFLKLDSIHTARRLLLSDGRIETGGNRNGTYYKLYSLLK